jgi:hypothetical protein
MCQRKVLGYGASAQGQVVQRAEQGSYSDKRRVLAQRGQGACPFRPDGGMRVPFSKRPGFHATHCGMEEGDIHP